MVTDVFYLTYITILMFLSEKNWTGNHQFEIAKTTQMYDNCWLLKKLQNGDFMKKVTS